MGVVYHTHYLDFFEAARTEALRELGLAYKDLEDSGIMMPVVDVHIRYHRPCKYDEMVEITTFFPKVPDTRVKIEYEVRVEGDPKVRVSGSVTLCFVDAKTFRPVYAPQLIKDIFESVNA